MCNLCDTFEKSARHLAERSDILINQWRGANLAQNEIVAHAMGQLNQALRRASRHASIETFGDLQTALSLYERAIVNCMSTNPQRILTEYEQELVKRSGVLISLVDQAIDNLGGLVPGHVGETDVVIPETDPIH